MLPILHIGSYAFYSFGVVVGIGIVLSSLAFMAFFERHHLRVNTPFIVSLVVVVGFLSAHLDDAFFNHAHPHRTAWNQIAQGGYTYFGGFLAGTLVFVLYTLFKRLPLLRTLDSLFCVSIAYGIGRIGCFTAGDGDYGTPSNLPWAVAFPHGVVPTLVRVHPTMLYITVWELSAFAILWPLSNPNRNPALRPGTLLAFYLLATGFGRFLVEFLSRNPTLVFGLKEAQLVALACIVAGCALLARPRALPTDPCSPGSIEAAKTLLP